MAYTTSHQDSTRKGVGTTAHAVAYMRQLEHSKGENALIVDPYAEALSMELGSIALKHEFS